MPGKQTDPPTAPRAPLVNDLDWGLDRLDVEDDALRRGRFIVRGAAGVFPDGFAFDHDSLGTAGPLELDVPADVDGATIELVRAGPATAPTSLALKLAGDGDARPAIALARLQGRTFDGSLAVDANFVPPTRRVHASAPLSGLLQRVMGSVEQRARSLAERFVGAGPGGLAGVVDFILLADLNVAHVELAHLRALPDLHPERLYLSLARLLARLRTYQSDSRLAVDLPAYRHAEPGEPFKALASGLLNYLASVLAASARQLPIAARSHGVHTVVLDDAAKSEKGSFVLQVQAQVPAEQLRSRFASQAKVGPAERIRDLVNLALPGIALRPLAVVPRQLPYSAGSSYFQLETAGSELWGGVVAGAGMALYVGGDFPGLELALWFVADQT